MRRFLQISDAAAIVTACALLAGCSSSQRLERYSRGPEAGNQGGAWEAVLGAPGVPLQDGFEYARLDDSLNIQQPGSLVNQDAWPEFGRPDLDQTRRIILTPRADQVIYFGPRTYHRRW